MKKIIMPLSLAAVVVSSIFLLVGWNKSLFDTHWQFNTAVIKNLDGSCMTLKVQKWIDFPNSDMIQVETADKVYLTHSANVILIKNK